MKQEENSFSTQCEIFEKNYHNIFSTKAHMKYLFTNKFWYTPEIVLHFQDIMRHLSICTLGAQCMYL